MLKRRVLMICFALVVVILIIVKIGTSQIIVEPVQEQLKNNLEWEIEQQQSRISVLIENRKSALMRFSSDLRTQSFFSNMIDDYLTGQRTEENAALLEELMQLAQAYGLTNLRLIGLRDNTLLEWDRENGGVRSVPNLYSTEWRYYMQQNSREVAMIDTGEPDCKDALRLSVCVYDSQLKSVCIGYVIADINLNDVNALFDNKDTNLFLLNEDDQVIPSFNDYYGISSYCSNLENNHTITVDEKYLLTTRSLDMKGWRLAGVISLGELYTIKQVMSNSFWFIMIIAVLFTVAMYFYASYYITEPILELTNHMVHMGEGEMETIHCEKQYDGEIKILYDSYNQMTERINTLIEEAYHAKVEEKEAELRALQAQINPHFIYNTLDTINWMAEKYQAEDIQDMILSLATMLRCSLNNGENMISVKGELDQVKSYLKIQKTRNPNLFDVEYEIDENILPYQIIKLVLQPLVENAIRHGFDGIKQKGKLIIKGRLYLDQIVLEVINTGNKPDLEYIKNLLNLSPEEKPKSYGIRNVNEKLKKTYGDQYVLKYEYYAGKTRAAIHIPIADQSYNARANQLLEKYKNIIHE